MKSELKEISEKLDIIISLMQRMPEIQAAVFLNMQEEKGTATLQGRKAADLWVIPRPEER